MSIYKAYDIRGTYPDQIDEATARRIGAALASFLSAKRLVVGRDMRTMAPAIQEAVIEGILEQGCDVVDIGLASTPMLYYAIGVQDCDGGLCITASHNSKEYIGFKLCRAEARPLSMDSGIAEIRDLAEGGSLQPAASAGARESLDIKQQFVDHIAAFVSDIAPMKIVVDYANGMGAAEAPEIFAKIDGLEVISLYEELDGTFPNHEANPLHEPNLDDLRAAVQSHGTKLGLAFDGDADRCAFVDEDGRTVHADLITAILARDLLARHPGAGIIYDLRSSKVLPEQVEKLGGRPVRERVGHSFMKETMRKEDCVGGGELSGHFYFADNYYTDCGVLAGLMVLNQLSREGRTLKEAADELRVYHSTPEVNFQVDDKEAALKAVVAEFVDGEVDYLDGVTVTYPDWWVNVRPSNTEPFLRMRLEANTGDLLSARLEQLISIIGPPVSH